MNKCFAVVLASAFALVAQAQQVQSVTIGDNFNYGFTYHLPQTVLEVAVSATCTKTVAGQFAPYAEKFLGLHDVPQADQVRYEVTQLSMRPVPKADPLRMYHITFSEKGAMPTFYLTEDRCLCAINRDPQLSEGVSKATVAETEADAKPHYKPSDVMTADILKAGSKAKQAELCAQEILSIRESRSELIRGEADNTPKDGLQLKLMLDNLAAQEEALLSLFVGTTTTSALSRTYSYIPQAEVQQFVLFRFSSELGFVEPDDLAGSPYYINVSLVEDLRMEMSDPKALKKLEKGIAFCVPGKAHVQCSDIRQTLFESDFLIAQFGHVEQLPQAQFGNAKKPCAALLEPSTGALRMFEQ